MTPLFQPRLLNTPFGDPALYVRLQGEGSALLFDIGDISRVSPRLLLRITDVFITHTHIDHFIGIDHLLRLNLARERVLRLYGPSGIIAGMTGKLKGYTWNLTDSYPFILDVHEIRARSVRTRRFTCHGKFRPGPVSGTHYDGTVAARPHYRVFAQSLDHNGIVSLAYRLEELFHININSDALNRLGLAPGPWLHTLKQHIRAASPDDTMLEAPLTSAPQTRGFRLGDLKRELVHITRGEIITYISDCGATHGNIKKIKKLAAGSDQFFCEAAFLESDAARAERSGHLTAHQAGKLARECGAKKLTVFHFSPRYESRPDAPDREAQAAFRGR